MFLLYSQNTMVREKLCFYSKKNFHVKSYINVIDDESSKKAISDWFHECLIDFYSDYFVKNKI